MVKKSFPIILIQARINSTRLKGKILLNFFNEKIIERIIRIAKEISSKKKIFILTGVKKKNHVIENIAKKHNVSVFFGEEENVLKRFKSFIEKKKIKNKYIIRITSDNYLIQPSIVEETIKKFVLGNYDYGYIDPLSHFGGEIFKGEALFRLNKNNKNNKEHVTYELRKNKKFKILKLKSNFKKINHKKYITLDTFEDLMIMKKIQKNFKNLKALNCIKTLKSVQKKWKSA